MFVKSLQQIVNNYLTQKSIDKSPILLYNVYRNKRKGNTTMKNIYTIYTKTTEPNNLHYANANRFVRAYTAEGEEAMKEKVAALKQAGIEVTDVYNRIGQKVKF